MNSSLGALENQELIGWLEVIASSQELSATKLVQVALAEESLRMCLNTEVTQLLWVDVLMTGYIGEPIAGSWSMMESERS